MNQRTSIHHPPIGASRRARAAEAASDASASSTGEAEWVDATHAAALLDVKKATLYAYASRGLVRTVPSGTSRERLYAREDLVRLRTRSRARAGHAAVAAAALQWGEPVLDTHISGIDASGPHYRGHPIVELVAGGATFESVAELLWTGRDVPDATWPKSPLPLAIAKVGRLVPSRALPLERLQIALPMLAASTLELAGDDDGEPRALHVARALVRHVAALVGLAPGSDARVTSALEAKTIAGTLALALGGRPSGATRRALDRALVLLADHELNVSTFAARVAASTGATLHMCVIAALAALSGPAHGGRCDLIETLLAEAEEPEDVPRMLRARLARGEAIPGFGHPAYPDGDPRAPVLLELADELGRKRLGVRKLRALVDTMALAGADAPSVDLGLVALASALELPAGSATAIMAVSRTAGWLAHALEQRAAGQLLRPRARYVADKRSDTKR